VKRIRQFPKSRGSASLELLGILPAMILVIMILIQAGAFVYAMNGANQAVRDGARAKSLGQSPSTAVHSSLPGGITAKRISHVAGENALELEVSVPTFVPRADFTITRTADMP